MIALSQVHDPLDHLGLGGGGAVMRLRAAVPQPVGAVLLETVPPLVERGPADALVAARRRHVARHLFRVAQHRQAVSGLALLFSIVHLVFLSRKTLTVNDLHQFYIDASRPAIGTMRRAARHSCNPLRTKPAAANALAILRKSSTVTTRELLAGGRDSGCLRPVCSLDCPEEFHATVAPGPREFTAVRVRLRISRPGLGHAL